MSDDGACSRAPPAADDALVAAAGPRTARLPPPRVAPQQHHFSAVQPASIHPFRDDPSTLILDIRPHAAHAAARISSAVSLSVPTTLLKRPLFSLSKLSQMLPSPSSRARFASWPSASRIFVYDSDSTQSPDNSIITGLLRKFRAEGFAGELGWVRGGFQAVWREAPDLATTDLPPPEEDDNDVTSSSAALRTSQLPKSAFSLVSTAAAPPLQHLVLHGSYPLPNTPCASASQASNPFFDTIRQNVELSHGITECIPLRLSRRVRRRIHDLPFSWLQDIARRSALRHSSASRHPGLDSLESGSESSDDPHTSDPDDNDPSVEEGTEALAMQFYRIELAEQRRLRSIMDHHTRESEPKPRRPLDNGGATVGADPALGGVSVRTGPKSVSDATCPAPFPFSIAAAVEKGTKNRYTHIWPFEHARVRLHDGRHQGSHPGRRNKNRSLVRSRSTRDRILDQQKAREEQGLEQDRQRQSRSSPPLGKIEDQQVSEVVGAPSRLFLSEAQSSITGICVGNKAKPGHPSLSPATSVPEVKIQYDVSEHQVSSSSTPATALALPTPPFFTPMETFPNSPMRTRPPQPILLPFSTSMSSGSRLGAPSVVQVSSVPSFEPSTAFPLRLPNRPKTLLPSMGEQTWSASSPGAPLSRISIAVGELTTGTGTRRDLPRAPSPVDDYVNASYVQPLGTRKRYIATQGPLPSTYVDFWTLIWEQNVHVIVMLTREVENAMVKCGSYWTDAEYGPLRLEILSTSPPLSPGADASTHAAPRQGYFTIREPQGKMTASRDQPTLVTRVFALSHTSYPGVPPRKITHLQYLDWSDMNVPDDPYGVLDLIKRTEEAVAESTPGPSPGGSMSPGSASGSLSDTQSLDIRTDQAGHDTLLSPTSASRMPGERRRRRGNEWRHPELDLKTGVATFALGKAAPVLLHCSAGVGRTGGFIAVDAVLDGIRRELRNRREKRNLERVSRVGVVVPTERNADMNDPEASGELTLGSTEGGVDSGESSCKESVSDGSDRMDVDEPTVDKTEVTRDLVQMINTVPIPVSAVDHIKSRRQHHRSKNLSGGKLRSGSEPLVMHVPYVETNDVPGESNVTSIDLGDPKVVGWQSSSTREWAEQVSDQTHAHGEGRQAFLERERREESPGSASNSSGPCALNSTDSVNGSNSARASGSASGSVNRNKVVRKSGTGSASASGTDSRSGSCRLPPSSTSKLGSGSISFSNSGSGTGTGSRLGSSLLPVRMRESSVTSISVESMDSFSPGHEAKMDALVQRSSMIHTNLSSDMEIDCPPRPVSAPLQSTQSGPLSLQRTVYSKPMIGSSPVASFSMPILPPGPTLRNIPIFREDAVEGPASRPNSGTGSDGLASPPQEFESGESADAEGSGKNSQQLSDESRKPSVPLKTRSNLRLNTELNSLSIPGTMQSGGSVRSPPHSLRQNQGAERATIPLVTRSQEDSASQQFLPAAGAYNALEKDQRKADQPVIDYKLPRELHSDLPPPLISSFAEPICTVIQDMREQRMSLCQSLRQYVFVHAAIIEGALRIVDEERELWGSVWTSDEASPADGEPGTNVGNGGREVQRAWTKGEDKAEMDFSSLEHEYDSMPACSCPLHIPASSRTGTSSPSKGKRGPSPTELLREDKNGALSSNKRPSIHRQGHEANDRSSGVGECKRGSVGTSTIRPALGRPAVPEKEGCTVTICGSPALRVDGGI